MNKGFWQLSLEKVVYIGIMGVSLLFLLSNAHQWWQYRNLELEKANLGRRLEKSRQENKKLAQSISYSKTDWFIKNESRKLGRGKNGETIVFLPSPPPKNLKKRQKTLPVPAWQAWWRMFFPVAGKKK